MPPRWDPMSGSHLKTQRAVYSATALTLVAVALTLYAIRPQPEVRSATYTEIVLEVAGLH